LQSLQFLDRVERKGRGWNLSLQTLDGIVCHDGEVHNQLLKADWGKTFESFDLSMQAKKRQTDLQLTPMTLEGCVVRMADTISYIGRDIEDAIRLKVLKRDDLPGSVVARLGCTNGTIVYNLVTDIIQNSFRKPHVAFSPGVSEALKTLKDFNLSRIYLNPIIKKHTEKIKLLFDYLFNQYLNDLEAGREESVIFHGFLKDMDTRYFQDHAPAEVVRDFIAGMTDKYFLRQCPEALRPAVEIR
jgi:dGTPase